MFCRIAGAQSAEQSVGIMGSKAFDPSIITYSSYNILFLQQFL